MAGRPPKFESQARGPRIGVVYLPAEGRRGKPPRWPLDKMRRGELRAWRELWATPQACEWERLGWDRIVARYCRVMVVAENSEKLDTNALTEARQLEDRLGLSPKAMRMMLWLIVKDEVGQQRQETSSSGRQQIRAVE